MYIKDNSITKLIVVLSLSGTQAFEVVTDLNVGMQTNSRQLELNISAANSLVKDAGIRKDIITSIGGCTAEYSSLQLGIDFDFDNNIYLRPNVDIKLGNKRIDAGVRASFSANVYEESMLLSTYVDTYYSWFYNDLKIADSLPVDIDYGVQLDVALNSFLDMRIAVVKPIVLSHAVTCKDYTLGVMNRSNIMIGLSWHLMAEYDELTNEYVHIIQEPISIPRIDLIEVPKAEEEKVAKAIVTLPEDIEETEVELGWFAWIIEFIARLFRF